MPVSAALARVLRQVADRLTPKYERPGGYDITFTHEPERAATADDLRRVLNWNAL